MMNDKFRQQVTPSSPEEEQILAQSRQALDESVDPLPDSIRRQLAQARQAAMEQHKSNNESQSWHRWQTWGVGLAASLTLAVVVTLQNEDKRPQLAEDNDRFGQMMQLAQLDDEDMAVVEDLEFAYWLSHSSELENGIENNNALPDS